MLNRAGLLVGLVCCVPLVAHGAPAVPPPASLIVYPGGGPIDLGAIDSGEKFQGKVEVVNFGPKGYSLLPQSGISRVRVLLEAPKMLNPGDRIWVPFEIDGHGLDGAQTLTVEIPSTDPGARSVKQDFTMVLVSATTVSPFWNTVLATQGVDGVCAGAPVPVVFSPGPTSGPFASVGIEESGAPLVLSSTQTTTGEIRGTVSIDSGAILRGAAKQGQTRIIGVTSNGNKNFVTIQWLVKGLGDTENTAGASAINQ